MSAKARTRPTGVTAELSSVGVTRYVWWGFLATLLVTFGSWGAGAKLTQGSWLPHLHLEWLRFGHGQLLSQVFFWAGLALLLVTWLQLGNVLFKLPHDVLSTKAMLLVTVVWMAPLIIAGPILSRDSYSYLAQGTIQYMGYSAYEVGPNVMNTGDTLNPLYLEVSGDWRNTTTPYGPLHLGLMAGIVALTNGNIHLGIFLIKILCMLSLVGIAWAAGAIASDLHQSQAIAVWIGALNPVVLLHLVGGMHNEAFMVALMGIGLAAAVKGKNLLGIFLITLGAAVKATAFVALPFLVWIWVYQLAKKYKEQSGVEASTRRKVGYFFATAGGGAVFSLATFGVLSYLTGTGLGFLTALKGSGKVINWLTLPTAFAHFSAWVTDKTSGPDFSTSLVAARSIFFIVMVVLLVAIWARWRKTPTAALRGLALAFLAICFCNSLAFPWYYSWIFVLVGSLKLSQRAWALVVAASAWGAITVGPNGIITLYNWGWMGVAAVVFFATYWYMSRKVFALPRRPLPAPVA
ncbi:MAG TPA: polyprenol phosphomannose-dependent alpha 1,6 mannosyltransferase MptB [Corynebacteriales bacterium]|nr:polyprenol phosphomannose-dependent alpha 1,6 mannosyltransferase MptB [Mycobacteriales bacterium]